MWPQIIHPKMAQKKLNPKQGIQPIFICPKIDNRHRRGEKKVDFLEKFFLFACLKILVKNHCRQRHDYHGSLPSTPYFPSFAS